MNDEVILSLLREVRKDQKEHTVLLTEMRKDIEQNTEDLSEHIKRTNLLEAQIAGIEEPLKFASYLKKWIIGTGAISGAIIGIIKLIKDYL